VTTLRTIDVEVACFTPPGWFI